MPATGAGSKYVSRSPPGNVNYIELLNSYINAFQTEWKLFIISVSVALFYRIRIVHFVILNTFIETGGKLMVNQEISVIVNVVDVLEYLRDSMKVKEMKILSFFINPYVFANVWLFLWNTK